MKGKLYKREGDRVWVIRYNNPNFTTEPIPVCELPIYHKDLTESQKWCMYQGMEIEFKIIDEFTNPELYTDVGLFEGITMAKLIF
jgi:hypothetical protein